MLDSTTIKVYQHAGGVKKGDITRKPDGAEVSAPVIKCKKTPRKKCSFVAEMKGKR